MAAAGYAPLAPHMLSEIPKLRVGSIGYDSPIKRICILPATSRYKAHKMLWWCGDDDRISPRHRSVFGIYTGKEPVKCIFA